MIWLVANVVTHTTRQQQDEIPSAVHAQQHTYAHVRHSLMDSVDTICWRKSQLRRSECNIEASFSPVWNKKSIGICVRDDDGAFVLAKTLSISPMTLIDGEALGLFHLLQSNGYKT